jgi:hypothetical protein
MVEHVHTPPEVSRLYIPERKFWKSEAADRFLNADGTLKDSFDPLEVPLISEDYPIVDIPAFVQGLRGLFIGHSDFPTIYLKDIRNHLENESIDTEWMEGLDTQRRISIKDNREHVQEQRLYRDSDLRVIDADGYKFCDSNERTLIMPWLVHNLKTLIYAPVPTVDNTLANAHRKGHVLTLELLEAAILFTNRDSGYLNRVSDIKEGRITPKDTERDSHGVNHFIDRRIDTREGIKKARDRYRNEMPEGSIFAQDMEKILHARPERLIYMLANIATRDPWPYGKYFRGTETFAQAHRLHKEKLVDKVLHDADFVRKPKMRLVNQSEDGELSA